jgi:hypothetical protein
MKPTGTARLTFTLSAVVVLSSIVACSSDDDTPAPEKKDAQLACNDLCRASAYTNATQREEGKQLNCYCSVGPASAKVEVTACTKMCSDIGRSGGKPFGANVSGNPDACQCD